MHSEDGTISNMALRRAIEEENNAAAVAAIKMEMDKCSQGMLSACEEKNMPLAGLYGAAYNTLRISLVAFQCGEVSRQELHSSRKNAELDFLIQLGNM